MSVRAINWALDLDLAPAKKLVMVVLADYSDENGYSFPGVEKIAQRASVSPRQLSRIFAELEEEGYLTRERRHLENGNRTSNGYQIHPPTGGTNGQYGRLTSGHLGRDKRPTVAATGEPSVEPSVNKNSARARAMPDDLTWNEGHAQKANQKGLDVAEEFAKFQDHHLAKGSKFVDWSRAFHTWLNNARAGGGFGQRPVATTRPSRDQEIHNLLTGSLGLDSMRGLGR